MAGNPLNFNARDFSGIYHHFQNPPRLWHGRRPRFAFEWGVAGIADVIAAYGQLKAVDAVIGAIRRADKQAGAESTSQPITNQPAVTQYPPQGAYYEPRLVVHPEPAYTGRPQWAAGQHSVPIEKHQPACEVNLIVVHPTPVANEEPLQPPWAVVPWENPLQSAPKVKLVYRPPDMKHRAGGIEYLGAAIDVFI